MRNESTQTEYTQGPFQQTGQQLDLAIEGRGFFQVLNPSDSKTQYSRAGNFSINKDGQLVIGSAQTGRLLQPPIQIPPDATGIVISSDGIVEVQQPSNKPS